MGTEAWWALAFLAACHLYDIMFCTVSIVLLFKMQLIIYDDDDLHGNWNVWSLVKDLEMTIITQLQKSPL